MHVPNNFKLIQSNNNTEVNVAVNIRGCFFCVHNFNFMCVCSMNFVVLFVWSTNFIELYSIVSPMNFIELYSIVSPMNFIELYSIVSPMNFIELYSIVSPMNFIELYSIVSPMNFIELYSIVSPMNFISWVWRPHGQVFRANSSISAMWPPCYYLLEEIVILGVIYGSSVWMICNPAAPAAPAGQRGRGASLP